MAVHVLGLRGPGQQVVEEGPALLGAHAHDAGRGGAEHQRAAARPVLPHQRVLLGRALAPVGDLLGRGVGDGRALRRLDRVDDPHRREAFLLVVGEVVVGGVAAGELGLAARLGHRVGAEHGGHDRDVVGAAVDVPVERAAQVGGRRVLRGVERHPEDLGVVAAAQLLDLAQPAAPGDLRLVVDVQVAEHQRPVGLERLEAPVGEVVVVEQAVLVDAFDQRADGGCEFLGRDHAMASARTVPKWDSNNRRMTFPAVGRGRVDAGGASRPARRSWRSRNFWTLPEGVRGNSATS